MIHLRSDFSMNQPVGKTVPSMEREAAEAAVNLSPYKST